MQIYTTLPRAVLFGEVHTSEACREEEELMVWIKNYLFSSFSVSSAASASADLAVGAVELVGFVFFGFDLQGKEKNDKERVGFWSGGMSGMMK